MSSIQYHPVLSSKENVAELPGAFCSQLLSSWLVGVKDLVFMLSLQRQLLFF